MAEDDEEYTIRIPVSAHFFDNNAEATITCPNCATRIPNVVVSPASSAQCPACKRWMTACFEIT